MTKRGLPPIPRVVLANGKRPCRGCGAELPKGRSRWCSSACSDKHYMALSSYARSHVYQRDRGVCAICGCDSTFLGRMSWVMRRREDRHGFVLLLAAWGHKDFGYGWHVPSAWEADHIVPLVEGGTNDLSNYRTLCVACHKAETAALAARRAARRKLAANR